MYKKLIWDKRAFRSSKCIAFMVVIDSINILIV